MGFRRLLHLVVPGVEQVHLLTPVLDSPHLADSQKTIHCSVQYEKNDENETNHPSNNNNNSYQSTTMSWWLCAAAKKTEHLFQKPAQPPQGQFGDILLLLLLRTMEESEGDRVKKRISIPSYTYHYNDRPLHAQKLKSCSRYTS